MTSWYNATVLDAQEARRHIGSNVALCFVRKRPTYTIGKHTFPALVMVLDAGFRIARLITPQEARACLILHSKLDGLTSKQLDEMFATRIAT